ncbi:flagellar motor protein MotB [Humitalea sp. 24SJ18S-53]|uniref:flagellar motor protein MotB n=1 Tax=Humitalea sp. 24SJ18S-53 TaxID=3422307 RepID=UPI003D66EC54
MAKGRGKGDGVTIIIKREEVVEGGHHGGAWKVAYADFVTAMMAFFLLMWLLNATTEEQRRGIADYFAPTNVFGQTQTGSGEPFGGRTPHSSGDMASDTGAVRVEQGPIPVMQDIEEDYTDTIARQVPRREGPEGSEDENPRTTAHNPDGHPGDAAEARSLRAHPDAPPGDPRAMSDDALRAESERRERAALERLADQLREAVASDPALADLARQLMVEQVPEGLRIQLLDADRQPLFASGSAGANERARLLFQRVAQIIGRVPNAVAVTGHTDSTPFRGSDRTNWDLSADRANAARRLLMDNGVAEGRIRSVAGMSDRDPLLPAEPTAAANRRVGITLLRQDPPPGTMHR